MQYRRANTPGGTLFFTVVTHHRRKFLCVPENIILLRQEWLALGQCLFAR
jgi:putative transposase